MNPLLEALGALWHGAGNVLDTPGSFARGLLAAPFTGQWDRPFTGILDPSQRVHGSEWTGNPWTGAAVDIATDPLNLIGGLGLLKTSRAAQAARASNAAREAALADMAMVGSRGHNAAGIPYEALAPDAEIANAMRAHYQAGEAADAAAMRPAMESFTAPASSLHRQQPGILGHGVAPEFSLPFPEKMVPPTPAFRDLTDPNWVKEAMYWLGDASAEMPENITRMFRPVARAPVPSYVHVPSQSPLLAALAGLNVGRLPTYLQSP